MKDSANKGFWERFAGLYRRAMRSDSPLYQAICTRMAPELDPGLEVLELACGTGQLSHPLAPLVARWEATDFSPAMIGEARRTAAPASLRFSVEDATALSFPDGSFDAVVIANALHVMPHPEQALSEIRRVLRPGGVLYAPTFIRVLSRQEGGKGCLRAKLRLWVMELGGFHTFFQWNEPELCAFIEAHGFRITHHETVGPVFAPLCYVRAEKTQ